jgi:hypothetical protein
MERCAQQKFILRTGPGRAAQIHHCKAPVALL